MEVYEITGYRTGIERAGVNFLEPKDSFETIKNGFIYRQELRSRKGFAQFGGRLSGKTRVMGIFENYLPTGTIELLVCDKNYLYKYDSATDSFTVIPTAGTLGVVHTFGIVNNWDYVSGTTYLTKGNNQRFIFTSAGMSKIYFYDGTDVRDFTADAYPGDILEYEAPALGPLTNATKVMYFNTRLNFFVPVINGKKYNQSVLYSAIKDASGNGDKFNTVTSGREDFVTYENMMGATLLGDVVIIGFQRSNQILEKITNKEKPYWKRQIPSVLGTDAFFSPVQWNYEIKSLGKTGAISCDGRKALRFDTKIPYFTQDEIDADNFELTYGGFDRLNGQFLFAYRDAASDLTDVTQDKVLVYNYEEDTWAKFDQRFSVFGQTIDGEALAMEEILASDKHPTWGRMDTTQEIMNKIGVENERQKTLAGDNDGFIYELNRDYNDYATGITGITATDPAVLTVGASAFKADDAVIIRNVAGMTEINDKVLTVKESTDTSITLRIDSTDFTAYTSGGTISKLIEFEAELVPFNPYREEGLKCYVSHVEFLLDSGMGNVYVDAFLDGQPSAFKTTFLEPIQSDQTDQNSRQWIEMVINEEANFFSFVINQNSSSLPVKITSIRIHADRGSFNNS